MTAPDPSTHPKPPPRPPRPPRKDSHATTTQAATPIGTAQGNPGTGGEAGQAQASDRAGTQAVAP